MQSIDKNEAAVSLGRLGGLARAKRLSKEELTAISLNANKKRWDGVRQHNSRTKLNQAIASGKIVRKPCEVCGEIKSEGHHVDYDLPFDVMWLCKKHHVAEHKRILEESKKQPILE